MKPAQRQQSLSLAAAVALMVATAGLLVVAAWSSGGEPLIGHGGSHAGGGGGLAQAVLVAVLALLAGSAALAVVTGTRRRLRDPAEADRYGRPFRITGSDRLALAGVIALVAAGSLAVIAVAGQLLDRGHRAPPARTAPGAPAGAPVGSSGGSRPGGSGSSGPGIEWAVIGLVAIGAGAAGVTLRMRARRRPTTAEASAPAVDWEAPPLRGTSVRLDDDREAIIAAFAAMEAGLAARGTRRRDAETAREFARRAFQPETDLAPPARELTALFERARFDEGVVTPADRRDAERALSKLEGAP
jgi:hypothetical protein